MRKILLILLSAIVLVLCFATENVWVYDSKGMRTPYELAKVDSLSFAEPGYIYISPETMNLTSDGGRFSVEVSSEKPWTATVSDPTAIILSKSSGNGGGREAIEVSAFPNTESQTYSETVTFKLDDGTTAVLTINVSVDDEYIKLYLLDDKGGLVPITDTSYINVPRSGGEFEIYVSSNTYWRLPYSYDNFHLSPPSGKYDETIKVTVDKNEYYSVTHTGLLFKTLGDKSCVLGIKQEGSGSAMSVGPALQRFPFTGGTGRLGIKSNKNWSVSCNQEWLKLGQIDGSLNDSIEIYVDECDDDSIKYATITVAPEYIGARSAQCRVCVGCLEKCKASDYEWVTIGTQTWMAENYRCSKYDTKSEAYNASWLTDNTLPTSEKFVFSPYYNDVADKNTWSTTEYAGDLNNEQIKKLGYLYNWAAAVGVEEEYSVTTPFEGHRQGICPNGWHIPTNAEWQTLYDYIYNYQELSDNEVGKYLKTTSGWYDDGTYFMQGTDSYGFAALPAGYTFEGRDRHVGYSALVWSATPTENDNNDAYFVVLGCTDDQLTYGDGTKADGLSVRCLKD